MKKALLFFFLIISVSFSQSNVNYAEFDGIIANPERGLQKYSITNNNYASTPNYSNINLNEITNWRTGNDKVTIIFRYFLLSDFLNSAISSTYLSNMQKDFEIIRNAGLKCIVRFSYSDNITTSPQQPTKSIILNHINQAAPVLNANKDVIVTHQAGFLGSYGEWYYTNSVEFGTEGTINATQWQNRKAIIDAMITATPESIPIQVRYPKIKQIMYGTSPLTASTAYQNSAIARIGFFNDAFLNNYGDQGTYEVNNQFDTPVGTPLYNYLSNETKYTPMSGETNGLNAPRTLGANAVIELDATNWSFLNRDYFTENFTNWIASGHFSTMVKKLGYRFVLTNSNFTLTNSNLSLSVNLENKGYARPFKDRKAYLVLKNNATAVTYKFLLNTDIRTWESTVQINQNIDIQSLPNGQYSSYLYLPDNNTTLQDRSEYSIQMANVNTWETSTGFNNLSQIINKQTLGIESSVLNSFKIYPNPVNDKLYIDSKVGQEVISIVILDNQGKKIIEKTLRGEKLMDLSSLSSGVYIVKISTANNVTETHKLVK